MKGCMDSSMRPFSCFVIVVPGQGMWRLWAGVGSRKRKFYEHLVYPSYKDEAARNATA